MLSLGQLRTDALLAVLVVTASCIALLRLAEWLAREHVERMGNKALAAAEKGRTNQHVADATQGNRSTP